MSALLLQQKLQDILKSSDFTEGKYQLPAIVEKDGSAGYQRPYSCRFNEVLLPLGAVVPLCNAAVAIPIAALVMYAIEHTMPLWNVLASFAYGTIACADDAAYGCSAGFDVDGKIQEKVSFKNDDGSNSKSFDFVVQRAGDDPMVVMTVSETVEYGNHGMSESFEVTLTDKKSINRNGW